MLGVKQLRLRTSDQRSGRDRRSELDRRTSLERRRHQRRTALLRVASNHRSGRDRREQVRRSALVRRMTLDRRGRRVKRLTERERVEARGIPEHCLAATGTPVDRVTEVVANTWSDYPVAVRTRIAKELFPLLLPIIEGRTDVTDELRQQCEDVAERWVGRIRTR